MSARPLRIAVVSTITEHAWGGSEELWSALAAAAASQGHKVLVCLGARTGGAKRIEQLRPLGVEFYFRKYPKPYKQFAGQVFKETQRRLAPWLSPALPALGQWRRLRRFRPDFIVVNQGSSYDAASSREYLENLHARSLAGMPCGFICHSNEEWGPINEFVRQTAIALFARASWVGWVCHRHLANVRRQLAEELPQGRVLLNPVNIPQPQVLPWPAGVLRMATVASLDVCWKCQDVVFAALAEPAWRSRDWRLSLFGRGKDEAYLRKLAAHYRLEDRIVFAGHTHDIQQVWREQQLLVLPSRQDAAPLAMQEAMLCGRPALVTDCGDMAGWIQDGRSGFVAEAPTVERVGAALERAWQSRDRLREMGQAAYEFALQRHDPAAGESLLKLIVETVESASRAGAPA